MKQITDRSVKMIVHKFKSQSKNRYDLCVQKLRLGSFQKAISLKRSSQTVKKLQSGMVCIN